MLSIDSFCQFAFCYPPSSTKWASLTLTINPSSTYLWCTVFGHCNTLYLHCHWSQQSKIVMGSVPQSSWVAVFSACFENTKCGWLSVLEPSLSIDLDGVKISSNALVAYSSCSIPRTLISFVKQWYLGDLIHQQVTAALLEQQCGAQIGEFLNFWQLFIPTIVFFVAKISSPPK